MLALLLAAPEGPASPIAAWESFYVIVGSSAGALIGLQFVVITLIADLPVARTGTGSSQ